MRVRRKRVPYQGRCTTAKRSLGPDAACFCLAPSSSQRSARRSRHDAAQPLVASDCRRARCGSDGNWPGREVRRAQSQHDVFSPRRPMLRLRTTISGNASGPGAMGGRRRPLSISHARRHDADPGLAGIGRCSSLSSALRSIWRGRGTRLGHGHACPSTFLAMDGNPP